MRLRLNYKQQLANVQNVDWARLAAFIDGEGTIYINQNAGKSGKTPNHMLSVSVTNTNPLLMKWLKSTFGGTVYPVKPTLGKKPIMRWQINARMAEFLLRNSLQYFVMKKEHAEVGLALCDLKLSPGQVVKKRLTVVAIEQREQLRMKIQHLNSPTLEAGSLIQ